MQLLPLSLLGPREVQPSVMQLGLFLPWVSAADGNVLSVKIIHERDQFLQDQPSLEFALSHQANAQYADYWSARIPIDPADRPSASSAWGTPGTYVYRFELKSPLVPRPIDWIVDPFAREFGIGKLSAFTLGFQDHVWSAQESTWRTPAISDLVVYELMLQEFQGDLRGAVQRLPYLADLGVNCIEVMPISNVESTLNWGFEPIGFFGVDERFGDRSDFQRFVDAAHQNGIAVILDVVYGHTGLHFPYEYVYASLGYRENPFMGAFAADMFGKSTDWRRAFVQDYFFSVNHFWLDACHVDGFRYDCVPNYWDGPLGQGYANLVYHTHLLVKNRLGQGHWQRFGAGGSLNLIQCAEQLEAPREVVAQTYSNATWQNATLGAAEAVARGDRGRLYDLGMCLGLEGYPQSVTANADTIEKTAFQYLENHDHSRFLSRFGVTEVADEPFPGLFERADRSRWFKVQPYLIALFTARGAPLLWQGQELAADSVIPGRGLARIGVLRPVPWEFFYDDIGRDMLRLVRKLTRLRATHSELRKGSYFFYNDWEHHQSRGVLLFSREDAAHFSLVGLNFSDVDVDVAFSFPRSGPCAEQLHHQAGFQAIAGQPRTLTLPSNYGRVWTV